MTATAATATAYDRVLDALRDHGSQVKEKTDKAQAQCPAHDDGRPSLSVTRIDGQTLIHCFAGCTADQIMGALGLTTKDLFDDSRGVTYRYDDGREVHRSPDKRFFQKNVTTIPELYRRSRVVDAVAAGIPVYLVEGEKDVHALEAAGEVATTGPQGSQNIGKTDLTPLHGGTVVAVVDRDAQGVKWAQIVAQRLEGKCESLTFVQAATGKDAADHIAAGHGIDEFITAELDDLETVTPAEREAARALAPALLDEVETFIRRFCVLPTEHAYIAATLWAAHTHFIKHLETTGRLACLSPEPGSGKTRVLEVLDTLAANPLLALDLSMSAFFRIVDDKQPTILLDEVDAIFTGKSKSEGTEDLRRVINNGYRIGAVVQRVGGPNRDQVQEFRVFTPVAMAGLGNLPDTLMSRSIILRMKRRAPGERVEPWRDRIHRPEGELLQSGLAAWAETVTELDYPELPDGVEDRDADVWEPLIMVADFAGKDWPRKAREACLAFIAEKPISSVSLGVRLLTDLKAIWPDDTPVMSTADILADLAELEDAPWGDLYGEGLKPRKLAQLLGDYEVRSKDVYTPAGTRKGYRREDLWDVWQRYVPARSPEKGDKGDAGDSAGQSVAPTSPQERGPNGKGDAPKPKGDAENRPDLHKHGNVADIADIAHSQGNEREAHSLPPQNTPAAPAKPNCPRCGDPLNAPALMAACSDDHDLPKGGVHP